MTNKTISQLTSATTPLTGAEVVPLVQSSVTKSATVANLTAGRSVSASAFVAPTIGAASGSALSLQSNGTTNATLNTAGNFGLGITPSTWGSILKAIEFGGAANFVAGGVGFGSTFIGANARYNGSNWVYSGNAPAAYYTVDNTNLPHKWLVSLSGTAGNPITFTTAWTIDNTGNYIQCVAAKGINFTANTPAAGMTSQLLNWYEEGAWTPTQGGGLTVVGAFSSTGKYTRIGREVRVSGTVTGATSVAVAAAGIITTNLPFTVGAAGHGNVTNAALTSFAAIICTSTNVTSAGAIAATGTLTFSATYFV